MDSFLSTLKSIGNSAGKVAVSALSNPQVQNALVTAAMSGAGFSNPMKAVNSALANPNVKKIANAGKKILNDPHVKGLVSHHGHKAIDAVVKDKDLNNLAHQGFEVGLKKARGKGILSSAKKLASNKAVQGLVSQVGKKANIALQTGLNQASGKGILSSVKKIASNKGVQNIASSLGKQVIANNVDPKYQGLANSALDTGIKVAGSGLGKRPAKGSPEMKQYMANLRNMRKKKGGSFLA